MLTTKMTQNLLLIIKSSLLYSCDTPLEQFYAGKLDKKRKLRPRTFKFSSFLQNC